MQIEQKDRVESRPLSPWGDFHWPGITAGFLVSATITLAIGAPLWVVLDSSWLFAGINLGSLFIGGFIAARMAQSSEPLSGAMIVLMHFTLLALAFFVAQLIGRFPDPLPGLDQSDSTFFFAWPLGQMVVGTVGALVGGLERWRRPSEGAELQQTSDQRLELDRQ